MKKESYGYGFKIGHILLSLNFLNIWCFIIFMVLGSCSQKPKQQIKAQNAKPNVVFILADDLGYGDLKCYNPESKIPTPHLDKLASEGMRFTDAHTPASLCTPTRYGLLTGQYAWCSPLKKGVLQSYDLELIADSVETIAKVFQEGGFETAHIGKWHLGYDWKVKEGYPTTWPINGIWRADDRDERIDLSKGIKGGPLNAGFDYSYGFDCPNMPPYCFWENGKIIGEAPSMIKPDTLYGNTGWFQKGWKLEEVHPAIEKRALSYLDEVGKKGKPFFLYLSLTSPHVPLYPTDEAKGKSEAGDYGDFVVDVDNLVGKVQAQLEAIGLAENTIVVFTSDNGSPARVEDPKKGEPYHKGSGEVIKQFGHKANGNFRGLKGDTWEGGHRVPMIVRWPGKVVASSVNDQLVCLTDWMGLAYTLTGNKKPANQGIDSYDLTETLKNVQEPVRGQMVHHSGSGKFAIRKGNWKLILQKGGDKYSAFFDPKGHETRFDGQLYNLEDDAMERHNVYNEYPEKVEELTQLLAEIKNKGNH
ncbi:MAG: arylsulfatase [Bacteroidota bacterium]